MKKVMALMVAVVMGLAVISFSGVSMAEEGKKDAATVTGSTNMTNDCCSSRMHEKIHGKKMHNQSPTELEEDDFMDGA
jgi:hypothetical protein